MPARRMHVDEFPTDDRLVRRLLETQFPQWAALRIETVESAGTDNALYRLGSDMVVRLPRIAAAAQQVEKEQRWLPHLGPLLPLPVSLPLARGSPAEFYPWSWSVCRWLEGENAAAQRIEDPHQAATTLAQFILALQRIDPTGGPLAGEHNFYRGVSLALRDEPTRAAIESLHGMIDTAAATAAWESARSAPPWHRPPVWIHGDLQPPNLLVERGRLTAVIDFGGLGVGDPACDLIVAWNFLPREARDAFRAALNVDDATWARGRGWALSIALIALPYYWETNPTLAAIARHSIAEVLVDQERGA